MSHPCMSCGACCAYFRVSFYWREAEANDSSHPVPLALTEERPPHHRTMKGTSDKHHVRCVALSGKVGNNATCTIYPNRPSPCRDFAASLEDGGPPNPRCDEARARYGLRALTRNDWLTLACGEPAGKLSSHEETSSP